MIARHLSLPGSSSCFLFGPRGTGKTTWFKDLTLDQSCTSATDATTNGMRFYDCSVTMQNVRVTGTNLIDTDGEAVFYCRNLTNGTTSNIDYLYCQFDNQSGRLLNFSGFQTNSPTGAGSTNYGTKRVICTDVFSSGTTAGRHSIIVAYPVTVSIYGGSVYDSPAYASTTGYNSILGFFFTTFPAGTTTARSLNKIVGGSMFACDWISWGGQIEPSGDNMANNVLSYYLFNTFRQGTASGGFTIFGATATGGYTVEHNFFTMLTGKPLVCQYSGITFAWNIVTNAGFGIQNYSYNGSLTNPVNAYGNTFDKCTTAIYSTNTAFVVTLRNNAAKVSTTSINTDANGMSVINSDYNVFDPTVSGSYVAGAHDTTGVDAALDSNYFPTSSGNCDGTGDTSIVDYVGGSDLYGLPLFYKSSRLSRGARENPAVYSEAVLYPDIW